MIEIDIYELETPFQPSNPVRPENFKGREEIIKKIIRYVPNALKNEPQHFFLTGNKGMGKTSICDYVMDYISYKYNMACAYVSNKGNDSVDELASKILVSLLNEVPDESKIEKLKTWFGDHFTELEIIGTKFRFNVDKKKQEHIKKDFPMYLSQSYEDLKKYYNGLFIIIDDINGLSDSKQFVDWYKQMADTIFVDSNFGIPVYFLLAGYPEKFDSLVDLELSFGRIFHYANVGRLTDETIKEFYKYAYKTIDVTVDEDALNLMTKYSSGIPLTMQQIGDSTFWNITSENITAENAKQGILDEANELRNKQMRKTINRIKSRQYENILLKIANKEIQSFTKKELENLLSEDEKTIINPFMDKMIKIELLKKIEDSYENTYEFKDNIYYTYYHIKSNEEKLEEQS